MRRLYPGLAGHVRMQFVFARAPHPDVDGPTKSPATNHDGSPGDACRFAHAQVSFGATPCPSFPGLPLLVPALPAPGSRTRLPALVGSADALAIAQCASLQGGPQRTLAVIAADALSAQRLVDEIPWFAPRLRVALFPDWETLPYDHFSPHQDLVSERLATLYRLHQASATWWWWRPRRRCTGCRRPRSRGPHLLPQAGRPAGSRRTARAAGARATRT